MSILQCYTSNEMRGGFEDNEVEGEPYFIDKETI